MDSLPSDIGVYLAVKTLEERGKKCKSVKGSFLSLSGGLSGGTFSSIFNFFNLPKEQKQSTQLIYALNPPPDDKTKGPSEQKLMNYDRDFKWTIPFLLSTVNMRVVRRTNALLKYNENEFSYNENMKSPGGFILTFILICLFYFVLIILHVSFFRKVIKKFLPSPGQGPSRKKMESSHYKMGFIGYPDDDSEPVKVEISGKGDPGYIVTAAMVSECALCLALERDELSEGGVLTPASAFGMNIIHRLRKTGMKIEVVDDF